MVITNTRKCLCGLSKTISRWSKKIQSCYFFWVVFTLLAHSNPTNTKQCTTKTATEPQQPLRNAKSKLLQWLYLYFHLCLLVGTHPNISRATPPHPKTWDNPRPHTIHHARPVRVFYCLLVALSTAPHQHPRHQTPHAQATTPTGHRRGRIAKIFI